jgi:hypothetical protein
MYFDDFVDEMVEDEEEDDSVGDSQDSEGDFDNLQAPEPTKERVFLLFPKSDNEEVAQTEHEHGFSTLESVEEGHEHDHDDDHHDSGAPSDDGSRVRLEAGLVDYCVMLGNISHGWNSFTELS